MDPQSAHAFSSSKHVPPDKEPGDPQTTAPAHFVSPPSPPTILSWIQTTPQPDSLSDSTEEASSQIRSNAIALIRERTVSRLSPAKTAYPFVMADGQAGGKPASLPAAPVEPVSGSKASKKRGYPKKNKYNKKKNKKHGAAGDAGVESTETSSVSEGVELPGQSSTDVRSSSRESSAASMKGSPGKLSVPASGLKESISSSDIAGGAGGSGDKGESSQGDPTEAVTEAMDKLDFRDKGKRRVDRVDPVTGDEIIEGPAPQPAANIKPVTGPSYAFVAAERGKMEGPDKMGSPKAAAVNDGPLANLFRPAPDPEPAKDTLSLTRKPNNSKEILPDSPSPGPELPPIPSHPGRSPRVKLPRIPEVGSEGVQKPNQSPARLPDFYYPSASPHTHTSTPQSTTTTATTYWPSHTQTPGTTAASPSSPPSKETTQEPPKTNPNTTPTLTHAHPLPPIPLIPIIPSPTPFPSLTPLTPTPRPPPTPKPKYTYNLDSVGFPCGLPSCPARCNLWDGATVICPRCGPFSATRYCSKAHLLADIKLHWATSCGRTTFLNTCNPTSIPRAVHAQPPLIPSLHGCDTPERHRQAVYFGMNANEGDYFVFKDWVDYAQGRPGGGGEGVDGMDLESRCSNEVIHVIKFEDVDMRDRFRRVLAVCLFLTIEVPRCTDYLYRLLRDHLRRSRSTHLLPSLLHQLSHEFHVQIEPSQRHACETDWDGRNRRHCTNDVCRSEYVRWLGSLDRPGIGRFVEVREASHWVLRTARITHPEVKGSWERMMGNGWGQEVVVGDRRVFSRGEGWDGVAGPVVGGEAGLRGMEMEE
ncbi:hypothetical protein BO70DRAFT_427534 [Aspergillus heteromorphus CBS 117.55]|uniref:Uncharacterized protein n=1 Tax=Aspergillus heteromorphus CBS 117.55 TaxID=1448321 RepID=A0A317WM88_9EURO|nr:uncharacterized protein BO70DRAFT_427534 [Aspergillus heteromorphus CBS 117.55]PWY87616.1 hypothetical protein BO70DRAFT_427534 [Aspergillus heteromorphus CBS 117.55]